MQRDLYNRELLLNIYHYTIVSNRHIWNKHQIKLILIIIMDSPIVQLLSLFSWSDPFIFLSEITMIDNPLHM